MAISIDWDTKIISVPKADTTLVQSVPTEIRELNLNSFRLDLRGLEAGEDGMSYLPTHTHNTEVEVGGVTLAHVVTLINGYTVTFEDGQYAVNLVGTNSNVGDNVNVNQVSVRSANSAGLTSLPVVEHGSFEGGVTIDVTLTTEGTTFPLGTNLSPVGNLVDAKTIAEYRGFDTFYVIGDITFGSGDDISGFKVIGQNASRTTITMLDASDTENIEINNASVTGYLDGGIIIRDSIVYDLHYINGVLHNCLIGPGTIEFGNSASGYILGCYSAVDADGPVFDLGGSGQSVAVHSYSGNITLENKTGTDATEINLIAGHVEIDSTVSAGTIVLNGTGAYTDNSTGTCVIDDSGLVNNAHVAAAVWDTVLP